MKAVPRNRRASAYTLVPAALLCLLAARLLLASRSCGSSSSGSIATTGQGGTPQPLLMFMTSRTGSSLMTETLNLHPRVLFEAETHNDPQHWTKEAPHVANFYKGGFASEYKMYQGNAKSYTVPDKDHSQLLAVGFKVRPLAARISPGSPAWRLLLHLRPKVVCSYRRNEAKATLSMLRADALGLKCGTANVVTKRNCTLPPDWAPPRESFAQMLTLRLAESRRFMHVCFAAAESFNTLFVAYEDLLADLPATMARVLRFVGLPDAEWRPYLEQLRSGQLPIGLEKATPDDLHDALPAESLKQIQEAAQEVYAAQAASMFS